MDVVSPRHPGLDPGSLGPHMMGYRETDNCAVARLRSHPVRRHDGFRIKSGMTRMILETKPLRGGAQTHIQRAVQDGNGFLGQWP